jgi:hypothetical protein
MGKVPHGLQTTHKTMKQKDMKREEEISYASAQLSTMVVRALEEVFAHDEDFELGFNDICTISSVTRSWVEAFAKLPPQERFMFSHRWTQEYGGKQFGVNFIAHYGVELFKELLRKRFSPVTTKDLSAINKMVKEIQGERGYDRSRAMTLAYKKVKRSGTLKAKSKNIVEECDILLDAFACDQFEGVIHSYPALIKGLDGTEYKSSPSKKVCILAVQMCKVISLGTGYK